MFVYTLIAWVSKLTISSWVQASKLVVTLATELKPVPSLADLSFGGLSQVSLLLVLLCYLLICTKCLPRSL